MEPLQKNNTGFIEPILTEDNYLLGSSPLPQIILREDGNWISYAPKFEPQRKQFETFNCTGFNTIDCIQRLLQRLGIDENYSDRFLGKIAGTKEPGNDPHTVAEAIRKNGLIPEDMLPFSDNLQNVDEYYSFKGANETECRKAGLAWLDRFSFGHEYVFHPSDTNKQDKMVEALKYSPLACSVDAWNERDGIYYKDKGTKDNHWTVCVVGYIKSKYWLIDDSYLADGNNIKKLDWNYDFNFCKRYHIEVKKKEEKRLIENIWQQIISVLQTLKNVLTFEVKEETRQIEEKLEPIMPEPTQPTQPEPKPKYDWSNTITTRYSLRLIGDELKLSWAEKDMLCDICKCESGYNIKAKLVNSPKSIDRGLFQWNSFYHPNITDEMAYNPEVATRLACKAIKNKQAKILWSASMKCWNKGGKYNGII